METCVEDVVVGAAMILVASVCLQLNGLVLTTISSSADLYVHSSYKLILLMGVFDVAQLTVHIVTGIFTVLQFEAGYTVYTIMGTVLSSSYACYILVTVVLAFNRFVLMCCHWADEDDEEKNRRTLDPKTERSRLCDSSGHQIFCKAGVLLGIGPRLYYKEELRLNACYLNGAVFLEIDKDFVQEYKRIYDYHPMNFNTYIGNQFAKDITYGVRTQYGKFLEYRSVVETKCPSVNVLSSGEIDAIGGNGELVEIKSQTDGLSPRFWREVLQALPPNILFWNHEEFGIEEIVNCTDSFDDECSWFKDDVLRFLDDFLVTIYDKLEKSPKTVFEVTKMDKESGLKIEKSEKAAWEFFPEAFVKHFNLAL
ncbi:hypothetical protein L596_008809 [Steinernema carpocapsae]|uniref:YqaJ viral recombinase domain-containing protein n=1 Tax=Steinernema carpocapsae TaxID=34508 RepID=A0A4U5PDK3_STECR|nr:hypothetical protein L596_008809 [Steinernema carpocapsae]